MRRVFAVLLLLVACPSSNAATPLPAPAPVDFQRYQKDAASLFSPSFITAPDSALATACERVLLIFQAISVLIIVGGMIMKLRKDHEQMEGIAAMMLKVAFIATIPFWRTHMLETADSIADAVGYEAISSNGTSSPLMARWWELVKQWTPPSTPQLDALEAQSADNVPASGDEQNWAIRAWNWAKGVGAATRDMFGTLWQTITGGLRSCFVLLCCAAMACVTLVVVIMTYFAEILRYFLFYIGCALLPVFIAGLGVEILKQQSIKYLLGLVSIACWPVAWSLVNIGTIVMLDGVTQWMARLTAVALGIKVISGPLPALASAVPYLAWGVLFLFIALTLAICLWSILGLVLAPVAMTKMITTGAQMMGGLVGATTAGTFSAGAAIGGGIATAATGGAAAPAAAALAKAAAGLGQLGGWAARAVGKSARGAATMAGNVGGARVGRVARSLANRMATGASHAAAGIGLAANRSASALTSGMTGSAGQALVGAIRGVSGAMKVASKINPDETTKAGEAVGRVVAAPAIAWLPAARNRRSGR